MSFAAALRFILRESRGARGRIAYFVLCLAVGVAAVVGTAALARSVQAAFQSKSRELLGADLSVDARRALPDNLESAFEPWPGTERTDVLETASMVGRPGPDGRPETSRLAQVHAIDGRYPLYGEVATEPSGGLESHLAEDTIVAGPELLEALGVAVGDDLLIGGVSYRVAAEVVREPPRFGFSSFLGPVVYMSGDGFARSRLLGFGSRVRHRSLFALPAGSTRADLDQVQARIEALEGASYLDVDPHHEVGPGGGRTTSRLGGFLGLVALLSLIVGGIGVAQIVRAWTVSRTRAIAVLRCLGLRPRDILGLSLAHVLMLAVAGSALGTLVGCLVPLVVDAVAPDLVPGGLPLVFPARAAARGLVLGIGIALIFALPPLTAVWRVPPARVLRSDAAPLPAPRAVIALSMLLLVGGVTGAAVVQAGRPVWGLAFAGGFVALAAVLYGGARLLVHLAQRVPRRKLGAYLAHGIAALARPGAGTTAAVVALGLGTLVVTSMWLVQTRLRDGLLGQVPPTAPSVFLIDVQPTQWPGVRDALTESEARHVDAVPVVTARIAEIDDVPVEELAKERRGGRRSLTREQRLTSQAELPPDNRVIAGELWSDPDRAEVSVEQRFAERIGVDVGSTIVFDVQGIPLELAVTSIRTVQWQSLSINFFLVVEPGVLDEAPGLMLASARLPEATERGLQNRMTRDFPNVTVLRLGPVLQQVGELIGRVAAGVSALGTFCVVAGLLVLAGAASATVLRRRREIALLKTLGVTRKGVVGLLAVEYGLIGALSGLIGAGGAMLLAWAFLTYVTEIDVALPWWTVPAAAAACAALTIVSGLAAGARALTVRPIEALRGRTD